MATMGALEVEEVHVEDTRKGTSANEGHTSLDHGKLIIKEEIERRLRWNRTRKGTENTLIGNRGLQKCGPKY